MSLSDIKYALRKLEFPASAKEALLKIENLLAGRSAPSSKQMDVAMEIISEFIFCEPDRRNNRRGLNPLQELQVIDIICDYITSCPTETTKNTIFLSLFGGMDSQRRLKILSILASMAVSASSTPVLLAVGVWLQQMGCSSQQSLTLVENIIKDHFYLNITDHSSLKALAKTAPQFVANFITAITELYKPDLQGNSKPPPLNLLEVITSWVLSSPSLCMSAQLSPYALPIGAIPMAAVAPLAGLVFWSALQPLYLSDTVSDVEMVDITVPTKKIKLENDKDCCNQLKHSRPLSESELYIKLHLGVLHSLRAGRRTHGPATAVNAQHLASMIPVVQNYAHQLIKKGGKPQTDTKLQDCLDRIGQAVQVALANGCVYGNINSLLAALDTLPENRLLRIVMKTHRQTL